VLLLTVHACCLLCVCACQCAVFAAVPQVEAHPSRHHWQGCGMVARCEGTGLCWV